MSTMNKEKVEQANTLDQFSVFYDFLKMIPRMWVLFLVLITIGGAIGYYISTKTYTPVYTASTTFTVNAKSEQSISIQSEFYDNMAAEQIAQTFPYILTSDILHRKVEADLGTSISGTINATVVENTNLLTLSVTDTNPQMAYKTLESVIKNYPTVSEPIVGKVTMNVLDETGTPTKPDNSKDVARMVYSGALFGLTAALLWAILVYFVNKTVIHKSEIKTKLGIDCLGSIPKVTPKKRTKADLDYYLITDPKLKGVLDEPYRMVRNKIEYIAQKNNYKTFLITSATATEGKSIFATNLSLSLAISGSKVILIDCDMRHPSGKIIFSMEQEKGLYEYLNGDISLPEYLEIAEKCSTHNNDNLLFLPGGKAIADGSTMLTGERMEELIDYAKENADYVILDSAPTGILTDSAVVAKYVDAGILVIRQNYARIDIIGDALSHLSESDTPVIGGVLNISS